MANAVAVAGFCCPPADPDEKVNSEELQEGPVQNRSCTDIVFLPIFVAAQIIFIIVTIIGMQDGDPGKLYKPRDYRGAYCGVSENWNNGPVTTDMPKLSYTMNVSSMADTIMMQTVCSSYASSLMTGYLLATQQEKDDYLCDCCLSPCAKCDGAFDLGGDLLSTDLASVISSKMAELTDPAQAQSLFSPGGFNGDTFSTQNFWEQVTKYVNQVCVPECMMTVDNTTGSRDYVYTPSPDSAFYGYWNKLLNAEDSTPNIGPIKATIATAFTFTALPAEVCPYHESLCVPMPGMIFKELSSGSNYCTFELAADVANALGSLASSAFESLGFDSINGAFSESFGKFAGDFQASLDTFIIVSVLSFGVGLSFLVLLRFFIGACVWIAVLCTILFFFFGGFFTFVLSGQCDGVGLLETGHQAAVAIVVASTTAVQDAVSGEEVPSESFTGIGADYIGRQQYTRLGKKCAVWETQEWRDVYRAANYAALDPAFRTKNYCRNPYNETDELKAKTIWCVTTDPDVPWEECIPIGVIQPECQRGYAVGSATMRDALYYSSFVIWALGIVWIVLVIVLINRIRLAIALNKVAAVFVATNPTVLLIPIVQAICAIIWVALWCLSASFLLSQVPDSYTPKQAYATYSEAFGTVSGCAFWETGPECTEIAGQCTNKWPTGTVWKDNNCDVAEDGTQMCWRCAPPRYVFDVRFAVSFFVYLWNNAFNIALGQMLIAMCVSLWFFSRDKTSTFVVKRGIKTILRYHIGTVAFGSFIVAVVQFIRYLMKYFEKQASARKNRCMAIVLKVLVCCIWCFEKCIKFLNKNAYIQTALMGTNFCVSAKKAFYLILRNILRFGTMAVLGSVVEAIGFFSIVTGTGCIGYLLMRAMHPDVSPFVPLMVMLAVAYIVARLYMSVFGLAVDTCLQCFLAVEEMGVGGDYIPELLKNFVASSGRKIEGNRD